ncbi:MAG TPA: aminotransferase class V-fold PLP-dependent enzyme [Chthoniobacterales bacterium]|nr:aminotransferase class V-fold PLP-dependent enzyme [Chthoniobacterales bacterium]
MLDPNEIIYLDNNATTQVDPVVLEEMLPFLSKYYGNPSSGYRFGAQVREALELARERVAGLLGCSAGEIVFTSGGTESIHTALNSALQLDPTRQHIVTTAVEHSATLRQVEHLAQRGFAVTIVGVDGDGQLNLDDLENAIRPETVIISAMWANNETGVLFPVGDVAEIARRKRVLFHTDAVQAAGKIPIDLDSLGASFCSISGHKFHAPKGVGALYVNRRSAFRPSQFGGGQENGRRAGTENVAAIVGLGKAAERVAQTLGEQHARVSALRDRFEATLLAQVADTFVNGGGAPRLPNTSSISFAGVESDAVLLMLDQQRVCCSAGSACRTGSREVSHVLRAMNLSEERLRGSVRFSLGRFNTEADVDRALEIIPRVIGKLRAMSAPLASV